MCRSLIPVKVATTRGILGNFPGSYCLHVSHSTYSNFMPNDALDSVYRMLQPTPASSVSFHLKFEISPDSPQAFHNTLFHPNANTAFYSPWKIAWRITLYSKFVQTVQTNEQCLRVWQVPLDLCIQSVGGFRHLEYQGLIGSLDDDEVSTGRSHLEFPEPRSLAVLCNDDMVPPMNRR